MDAGWSVIIHIIAGKYFIIHIVPTSGFKGRISSKSTKIRGCFGHFLVFMQITRTTLQRSGLLKIQKIACYVLWPFWGRAARLFIGPNFHNKYGWITELVGAEQWLKMTENLKIRKSYLPAVGRAGCLFRCNKYQTFLRFSVLRFVSFLLTDLLTRVRSEAIFSLVLQVLLKSAFF
jgi:hypothetical protein